MTALVSHGVLEARTDELLREGWEQTGSGIGAGYVLHREALVLLIDTDDVDVALWPQPTDRDQRGAVLLRHLVETLALYPDELADDERNYLAVGAQRARLASLAQEMTGGSVELRSDAILLSLPPDRNLPATLVVDFPAATARDWAALGLLDRLTVGTDGSFRTVSRDEVLRHARDLHAEAGPRLTTELRESPEVLVQAVRQGLSDIGLLRVDEHDGWTFTPLAGRYRSAHLDVGDGPAPATPTQFTLGFPEDA